MQQTTPESITASSPFRQPAAPANTNIGEGRFSTLGPGSWLGAGLATLLFAAALKFAIVDDALDVAPYPMLGGVVSALCVAIAWLRRGWIRVAPTHVEIRRRVGRPTVLPIEQIHSVRLDERAFALLSADGRPAVTVRDIADLTVARAISYFVAYRTRVPLEAFANLTDAAAIPPANEVRADVGRVITEHDGASFQDRGIVVTLGDQRFYVRTTSTGKAPGLGAAAMIVGVHIHTSLKLGDPSFLVGEPLTRFVTAVASSTATPDAKRAVIADLAERSGGGAIAAPPGETVLRGQVAGRGFRIDSEA